jgi:hypothetical protein
VVGTHNHFVDATQFTNDATHKRRYNLNKLHTDTHLAELSARVCAVLGRQPVSRLAVEALCTETAQFAASASGKSQHATALNALVEQLQACL